MSDLKDLLAGTRVGSSSSSSSAANAEAPVMHSALFGDLTAPSSSSTGAKKGKKGQQTGKNSSSDALGSEMAALEDGAVTQKTKKKSGGLLREVSQLLSSSSTSALGAPIDSLPTLVS